MHRAVKGCKMHRSGNWIADGNNLVWASTRGREVMWVILSFVFVLCLILCKLVYGCIGGDYDLFISGWDYSWRLLGNLLYRLVGGAFRYRFTFLVALVTNAVYFKLSTLLKVLVTKLLKIFKVQISFTNFQLSVSSS